MLIHFAGNDASACRFCPSPAPFLGDNLDDHVAEVHGAARFSCGLCLSQQGGGGPSAAHFDTFPEIKEHLSVIHSIAADEDDADGNDEVRANT